MTEMWINTPFILNVNALIYLTEDYPLCRVKHYPNSTYDDAEFTDYDDFYDDIWSPYIEQYEQANSSDLYVAGYRIFGQDQWCAQFAWINGTAQLNGTESGALYLSEKGIDDCDWVQNDLCCGDNNYCCYCYYRYQCCAGCKTYGGCCTGFAVVLMIVIILIVVVLWLRFSFYGTNHFIKTQLLAIIKEMDESNAAWE
eukprot:577864_1